jgi:hypothetical protein
MDGNTCGASALPGGGSCESVAEPVCGGALVLAVLAALASPIACAAPVPKICSRY